MTKPEAEKASSPPSAATVQRWFEDAWPERDPPSLADCEYFAVAVRTLRNAEIRRRDPVKKKRNDDEAAIVKRARETALTFRKHAIPLRELRQAEIDSWQQVVEMARTISAPLEEIIPGYVALVAECDALDRALDAVAYLRDSGLRVGGDLLEDPLAWLKRHAEETWRRTLELECKRVALRGGERILIERELKRLLSDSDDKPLANFLQTALLELGEDRQSDAIARKLRRRKKKDTAAQLACPGPG